MTRALVIDADGHITEPADLWDRYLDPAFREIAPRLVRTEDGVDGLEVAGSIHVPANGIGMPGAGLAGRKVGPRTMYEHRYLDGHPGGFEPRARLEVLDEEGIDAAVLFPTFSALLIAANPFAEFALALARAYNEWLADFCRAAPDRLFGVAQVPLLSLDAAVAELRRAVGDLGHRAVYVRPNPHGGRLWTDAHWDPFWSAAQELAIPIAFHEGTYPKAVPTAGADRFDNFFFQHVVSHPFEQQLACLSLAAGGVLERFPRLRVAFMESGCGWLPYWLERMDHHWEQLAWMVPGITRRPSEYFLRQCWVSCDPDEHDIGHVAEAVGAGKIVFASDFPHYDAIFPGAVRALRDRPGLGADVRDRILGGNAAELFGL